MFVQSCALPHRSKALAIPDRGYPALRIPTLYLPCKGGIPAQQLLKVSNSGLIKKNVGPESTEELQPYGHSTDWSDFWSDLEGDETKLDETKGA
eukprot:jgi/Botrbrau1/14116/Bobra.182_3s0059.1